MIVRIVSRCSLSVLLVRGTERLIVYGDDDILIVIPLLSGDVQVWTRSHQVVKHALSNTGEFEKGFWARAVVGSGFFEYALLSVLTRKPFLQIPRPKRRLNPNRRLVETPSTSYRTCVQPYDIPLRLGNDSPHISRYREDRRMERMARV